MWTIEKALAQMAGRPSDLAGEEILARLSACADCPKRVAGECIRARQLITVHALKKKNRCPERRWGERAEPKARPEPRPMVATSSATSSATRWKPAQPAALNRLDVVTCFYNPQNYQRPRANYDQFRAGIERAGLMLHTLELVFDQDEPQLQGAGCHTIRGTRARNLLWQKERLLNLAAAYASEADAIAWLDCDVLFQEAEWPAKTLEALAANVVVQPWSHSYQRLPGGELAPIKKSVGWFWHNEPEQAGKFSYSHPGFAWAARAEWFRQVGLYEHGATGSGDALMIPGLIGPGVTGGFLQTIGPTREWVADMAAWSARSFQVVQGALGFVPGALVHCYHGSRADRKYNDRQAYLTRHQFNPKTDLEIDPENGLLAWSESARKAKPEMIEQVGGYFSERREDD